MKNKALLVIDVQGWYTNKESAYFVADNKKVIKNINTLIENFEKSGGLIVYIKHFSKEGEEFKEGHILTEYDPSISIVKNGVHITKNKYDSFVGTKLEKILRKNKTKKVFVTGFMTNFCCESAARTAFDLGFETAIVKDATGTPGTEKFSPKEIIEVVCDTFAFGFGSVVLTKEI